VLWCRLSGKSKAESLLFLKSNSKIFGVIAVGCGYIFAILSEVVFIAFAERAGSLDFESRFIDIVESSSAGRSQITLRESFGMRKGIERFGWRVVDWMIVDLFWVTDRLQKSFWRRGRHSGCYLWSIV